MSLATRSAPREAAARAAVHPAAQGGHRGVLGLPAARLRAAARDRDRPAHLERVPHVHQVARRRRTRVHRPRELAEAPHRRGLLDVVHELDLDDPRDGRRPDHHRPAARRAPVRRHRPQVRRQGRQLPAGDLLPAADPPHRGRRHRDRLDRAPGEDGALNQMLGIFGIPPYDWLGRCPRRSSC